jgi:hypothetical protein
MKWVVLREGGERGPFALEEMQQLLAIGSLKETDAVRPEDSSEWIPLAQALARESPAAVLRQAHLGHEAALRAVGTLYDLGFAGCALGLVALVVAVFARNSLALAPGGEDLPPLLLLALALGLAAWGALSLWIGYNLRHLRRPVIVPVTVASVLGLINFPFGTLINGYILYLLHSAKGKTVFSDEYRAAIAATKEMKYRTSLLAWIIAGVVAVLILLAVGGGLFLLWRAG